jgi:hypothetical protein
MASELAEKTADAAKSAVDKVRKRIERKGGGGGGGGSGTKRPGNRGHPDHQADVRGPGRAQAEAQAGPDEQVLTEQPKFIQGYPGMNRRADNQVVDPQSNTRLVVESERRWWGQYHKKRVKEIEDTGIQVPTRFVPKKCD